MSLKVGFAWMFFGNVALAMSQWGLLILIAKGAGIAAVGQFALALAIASPLYALASFNLRAVQATDPEHGTDLNDYLSFNLIGVLVATAVILLIGYFLAEENIWHIILFVAMAKACETLSDMIHGFFQKHALFRNIGLSQIIKATTGLVVVAIVLFTLRSLSLAILGYAISRLLTLTFYDLRTASRKQQQLTGSGIRPRVNGQAMRYLFVTGFPIGLVVALNVLQMSLPRFALAQFHDDATVGYFSAMSYFIVAGAMFTNAWAQATLPKLSRAYVESRFDYVRILAINCLFAVAVGIAGVIAAALFGREILSFIYTPEFATLQKAFVLIMLAGGLSYLGAVIGSGVTAARSFRSQAVAAVIVSAVLAAALYLLIPTQGIIGAAIATSIAAGTKCLIQLLQVVRLLRPR